MLLQMLPFAICQIYASTLRETGETLLPMKAGLVAVFINLVFNYILIFGKLGLPALGVVGAAIATVIARLVECAIVIGWTHRQRSAAASSSGPLPRCACPRRWSSGCCPLARRCSSTRCSGPPA